MAGWTLGIAVTLFIMTQLVGEDDLERLRNWATLGWGLLLILVAFVLGWQ